MKKLFFTLLLLFSLLVPNTVFASGLGPVTNLKSVLSTGQYTSYSEGKAYDFSAKTYKKQGGGYVYYTDLLIETGGITQDGASISGRTWFNPTIFDQLKPSAKQDFLKHILTLANAMAFDTANGYAQGEDSVTDDTVSDMVEEIATQSGMGSALLATLLQNTKPNFAKANIIYKPFSGTIGTVLGVIAVLIMALLGVTMALDIAFITIPPIQMALGGGEGNGNDKKGGLSGFISAEAKAAVKAAESGGGSGGQGGSGEYRAAVGIYLKYRWKGLTILGLALLYLIQGQIYSFVAWFVDLFSGFLGF